MSLSTNLSSKYFCNIKNTFHINPLEYVNIHNKNNNTSWTMSNEDRAICLITSKTNTSYHQRIFYTKFLGFTSDYKLSSWVYVLFYPWATIAWSCFTKTSSRRSPYKVFSNINMKQFGLYILWQNLTARENIMYKI